MPGEESPARFHIRKAARKRLPAMNAIQKMCAGPHGSIAKGTEIIKEVGKYIFSERISGRTPEETPPSAR